MSSAYGDSGWLSEATLRGLRQAMISPELRAQLRRISEATNQAARQMANPEMQRLVRSANELAAAIATNETHQVAAALGAEISKSLTIWTEGLFDWGKLASSLVQIQVPDISTQLSERLASIAAVVETVHLDEQRANSVSEDQHKAVAPHGETDWGLSREQAAWLKRAAWALLSGTAVADQLIREVVGTDAAPAQVLYWSVMLTLSTMWILLVITRSED